MFFLSFSFIIAISLLYCGKSSNNDDDPGNIPGMGDAGGELEVDGPLSFPIGLSLVGDITGFEVNTLPLENPAGSGGQWVILDMSIQNVTDKDANFYLPGGSVVECQKEGYQHAICINRVEISVEAEKTKQCKLLVYCINKGRSGSSPEIIYQIIGVSNSDRIMRLVEALENKKIDIRDYLPDNRAEFEALCLQIQDVIWEITNGSGLDDEDWAFINSLPVIE